MPNIKQHTVQHGQTLIDIALMHYGSAEGLFLLMNDNRQLTSITEIPTPGTKLTIASAPINKKVVELIAQRNVVIASGDRAATVSIPPTIGDFNNDFNNDFL